MISFPASLFGRNSVSFGVFTALGTVGFYEDVAVVMYFLQRQSIRRAVWNLVSRPVFSPLGPSAGLGVTWFLTAFYRGVAHGVASTSRFS